MNICVFIVVIILLFFLYSEKYWVNIDVCFYELYFVLLDVDVIIEFCLFELDMVSYILVVSLGFVFGYW